MDFIRRHEFLMLGLRINKFETKAAWLLGPTTDSPRGGSGVEMVTVQLIKLDGNC